MGRQRLFFPLSCSNHDDADSDRSCHCRRHRRWRAGQRRLEPAGHFFDSALEGLERRLLASISVESAMPPAASALGLASTAGDGNRQEEMQLQDNHPTGLVLRCQQAP